MPDVTGQPGSTSATRSCFGTVPMDTMQVQAAISALYGPDAAEAARANTFLMEFTEQPVNEIVHFFF